MPRLTQDFDKRRNLLLFLHCRANRPNWIIDSRGWVEYLRGSDKGRKLKDEFESSKEIFTHPVTVAELISKFQRESLVPEEAWKAVTSRPKIIRLDSEDAKDAGLIHAHTKAKKSNFSLADSFVLQSARKLTASSRREIRIFKECQNPFC